MKKLGYSESQAYNLLYGGGLSIYTTQDPNIQAIVDEEINNPENYAAAKYSVEYRLSVTHANGETKHYSEEHLKKYHREILKDGYTGLYNTEEEAVNDVEQFKSSLLQEGDEILEDVYRLLSSPRLLLSLWIRPPGR